MSKKEQKSAFSQKDNMMYIGYKIADIIGIAIGFAMCAIGDNMAMNCVDEMGQLIESQQKTGNTLCVIGLVLVVFFGVMLFRLTASKDKAEAEFKEEQRIRKVLIEEGAIPDGLLDEESNEDENEGSDETDEDTEEAE
jgi:uncharacterized membrane-anchored protein YhcB (DUF1043 family)